MAPRSGDLVLAALQRAGVGAALLGSLEAHGTGTPLGDPTEAGALSRATAAPVERAVPLLVPAQRPTWGTRSLRQAAGPAEAAALDAHARCARDGPAAGAQPLIYERLGARAGAFALTVQRAQLRRGPARGVSDVWLQRHDRARGARRGRPPGRQRRAALSSVPRQAAAAPEAPHLCMGGTHARSGGAGRRAGAVRARVGGRGRGARGPGVGDTAGWPGGADLGRVGAQAVGRRHATRPLRFGRGARAACAPACSRWPQAAKGRRRAVDGASAVALALDGGARALRPRSTARRRRSRSRSTWHRLGPPALLLLLTCGSQAVAARGAPARVSAAAHGGAWGLARVLRLEQPSVRVLSVDAFEGDEAARRAAR